MTGSSKVEKNRKRGKPKGSPKTGGRKKGTPNKNSLLIREAMDQCGFNAIQEFILAYQQLEGPERKLAELHFLLPFVYPRLSDIQLAPEAPRPPNFANKPTGELLKVINGQG